MLNDSSKLGELAAGANKGTEADRMSGLATLLRFATPKPHKNAPYYGADRVGANPADLVPLTADVWHRHSARHIARGVGV